MKIAIKGNSNERIPTFHKQIANAMFNVKCSIQLYNIS